MADTTAYRFWFTLILRCQRRHTWGWRRGGGERRQGGREAGVRARGAARAPAAAAPA